MTDFIVFDGSIKSSPPCTPLATPLTIKSWESSALSRELHLLYLTSDKPISAYSILTVIRALLLYFRMYHFG